MATKFCKNCTFKNVSIPDRGNKKAQIVIVSSSPTDEEIVEDKILVDKAHTLLNKLFKKYGITEKKYGKFLYITSVNCAIPSNKFQNKDKIVNDCCRNCNKKTMKEIGKHPRKLIITLGAVAVKTVTQVFTGSMANRRGVLIKTPLSELGILPLLDPNIIVGMQSKYPTLKIDVKKVSDLLKYGERVEPNYTYTYIKTKKAAIKFANYINTTKQIKFLSCDIESTGLSPEYNYMTCIGVLPSTGKENFLQNSNINYNVRMFSNIKLLKFFINLIKKKKQVYLWHNGKFDLRFLRFHKLNKKQIHVDKDTQVLSYLLDENTGRHSLERCVLDHLQFPAFKDMCKPWKDIGTSLQKHRPKELRVVNDYRNLVNTYHKFIKVETIPVLSEKKKNFGEQIDIRYEALYSVKPNKENVDNHNLDSIDVLLKLVTLVYNHAHKLKVLEGITLKQVLLYIKVGMPKQAWALIPLHELMMYCAKDIVNMLLVHNVLYKKVLKDKELVLAYEELLIPASNSLVSIELNGMPFDVSRVQEAYNQYSKIVAEEKALLLKYANNKELNPNAPQQVLLELQAQGLKVQSTGKTIIEKYRDTNKFVDHLLTYKTSTRTLASNITKYLTYPTSRVHSSYSITNTVTGRLGSTSENNQNVPKLNIIRKQYAVSTKRLLLSCDYSQAELRALAAFSKDVNLVQIFKDGKDLHSAVAEKMFGKLFTKKQRGTAKTVNFGVIYGVQAKSLAATVNISVKDAANFINDWFKTFQTAKDFMDMTRNLHDTELLTIYGRRRRFHIIGTAKDHSLKNEAGNFIYQSTCSDFCLHAQVLLDKIVDDYKGNIQQINIIHDDNMFEMDNNKKKVFTWASKVKEVMEHVPVEKGVDIVPFVVDPAIGTEWNRLIDINLKQSIKENKYIEFIDTDDFSKLSKDDIVYRKSLQIETRILN